jgi:hypothetical protein
LLRKSKGSCARECCPARHYFEDAFGQQFATPRKPANADTLMSASIHCMAIKTPREGSFRNSCLAYSLVPDIRRRRPDPGRQAARLKTSGSAADKSLEVDGEFDPVRIFAMTRFSASNMTRVGQLPRKTGSTVGAWR